MIKILICSSDGLGFGHLVRGINIAKELRKLVDCKIVFVTNTCFTEMFDKEGFDFVRGGVDPQKIYSKELSSQEYKRLNDEFILSQIVKFSPDIVIFDLIVMPASISFASDNNIFSVYILRDCNNPGYFLFNKDYLRLINLVLFISSDDSRTLKYIRSIIHKNRIIITPNIFRQIEKSRVEEVKIKYGKKKGEFLITIAAGGGGGGSCPESVIHYFLILCKIVNKINKLIFKNNKSLRIRWILIKGPLFRGHIKKCDNMEIYDYEDNLLELFTISDMVISTGGYNSINEVVVSGVPAFIFPLPGIMDAQADRASLFARNGFIKVLNIYDTSAVLKALKIVLSPSKLKKMKSYYIGYRHSNGKERAALSILRKYALYLKLKKKEEE